ncbi:MAG: sugar ABC transporter substrate-binding protein [Caldithrix sp. RBG_13_44_9]|nr:MAG: sugar ABC transporter substrate-binding protein [Caldithrix sp. RBG_13_44_9]
MFRIWIRMVLLGLIFLFLSCGDGKKSEVTTKKISIAVIPKGTTHEFWKSIHAGAIKAGRELQVEVIWKGPLKEDDREAQISVVENFITGGVSGIVLAPLDETALMMPVNNAKRAGIPVVIIDSGLKGSDYLSYIATNNKLGGELAGKRLAELLQGKGKVIMLRYQEGSASTFLRETGFLEVIQQYPEIQVVSSNQFAGATTETAYRASENVLAPFKTSDGRLAIDGIFCPNESSTFGMLRALQDANLAGKVRFMGFDSSPKLIEALEKNDLDGLVLQNPFKMGYLGVKTMVDYLKNQSYENFIDTGVTLVTRENMNQPEIHELIMPDLSQWFN